MDFALTADQQEISKAVRALAAKFPDEYWAERDARLQFPEDFYAAFAEAGWIGIAIPEEFGGGGQGMAEAALVMYEVAASGAGMNGCSAMHLTVFGLNTIVKHGSEELKRELLPRAATGDLHVCFAVTEPNAGTDTSAIETRARRAGDEYVIDGRKVWITKADRSEKMVLLARTTPRAEVDRPTDGLSLFIVDLDSPAIQMNAIAKLGRNAVSSFEIAIDGLRVPEGRRVGEEGQGFRYLLDGLNPERILLANEALGIGRAALARGVAYARERVVFGRPIGQNQGISFPLAQAAIALDAAELMVREAAWRYDEGLSCGREANSAKYLCAEAGFRAADTAVQTHGGMGYAKEFHVERYFREARLLRLAPVSQEMALNYVAQHGLKLPKSY